MGRGLRVAFWTAVLSFALATAGCGLTLDYGPPDPIGMDASTLRDAATAVDGEVVDTARDDTGRPVDDASTVDDAANTDDAARANCTTPSDCATDEICVHSCDAAARGRCIPRGEPCAQVPTCGCDGVTYGSLCEAHGAGVEAADDPSLCFGCGPGGIPCGIVGQICLGCPDAPPTCVGRPFPGPPCMDVPVCGCDGHTYASNCDADTAGVLRTTTGACPGTCVSSLDCAMAQYCERTACGDVVGTCTALPTDTTTGVCGCSGRRYRSSHEALRREGLVGPCDRCPPPTNTCCRDALDCAASDACVGASRDCTISGVCEPLGALHAGICWSDEDCGPRGVCTGQRVCACGATCIGADVPGVCSVLTTG